MRVLVGTVEVAGTLSDLADGFRRLGHDTSCVVVERHSFYPDADYDVDLSWKPAPLSRLGRIPVAIGRRLRRSARIARMISAHDLFVFVWGGSSLTNGNLEYPIIRALGKRLVSVFMGDDVRYRPLFAQQFGPVPDAFVNELGENGDLLPRIKAIRTAERHANLILSQPNISGLALRPYMHVFVPIRLAEYTPAVPRRDTPIVVHAPSSSVSKGSVEILRALAALRSEGVSFELRVLEGVTNRHVRQELENADVAVDQLYAPLHGKFGVEAMASGCALATRNREDFEPYPAGRPIWNVEGGDVREPLRRLMLDRDLRIRLAMAGRQYVERYHDHVRVAERILRLAALDRVERYDHYPSATEAALQIESTHGVPSSVRRLTRAILRRWPSAAPQPDGTSYN